MRRWEHPLWLVPVTAAAAGIGFSTGNRVLFPLLAMTPAYPVLVRQQLAGARGQAVLSLLTWAATLGVTSICLCFLFPAAAAAVVWNGPAYASEMLLWLRTGAGMESEPSRFLVQHAAHTVAFVLLSLATASLASLFLGTLLLNYMAYYVARVIALAGGSPMAVAMAWHPWSVLRVVSFVILGVVLAEPLLGRITGRGLRLRGAWPWLAAAAAGLAADATLKALLAPYWRLWLYRLAARGLEGSGGGGW